jgi:hypothetical protein
MKAATVAAAITLLLSLSARAAERDLKTQAPGSTCIGNISGLSRVAYTKMPDVSCCKGQLACSAYLSTTMIERPPADPRT